MGFISFNENYYRRKLEEYENKILSDTKIRGAKQLLKVLDDLTDEGYTILTCSDLEKVREEIEARL